VGKRPNRTSSYFVPKESVATKKPAEATTLTPEAT